MKQNLLIAIAASLLCLCACGGPDVKTVDELKSGWENPPQSARTRVWWHWMNGNITKDGLKKDLEWMKRIGLGGAQTFDAGMGGATIVKDRLVYMHEGWKDAFGYAMKIADSLDLEIAIASSPGWSCTGGPWVEPKDAMKKLVWRTMEVQGGRPVNTELPPAFTTIGAFQNGAAQGRGAVSKVEEYYEDISVIAVRQPESRPSFDGVGISSSGGNFTLGQLTDGDIAASSLLPINPDGPSAWIQYEFPEEVTVHAVTLSDGSTGGFEMRSGGGPVLMAGTDGTNFVKVADIPAGRVAQRTISVPATRAKYFRILIENPKPRMGSGGMFGDFGMMRPAPAPKGTSISEFIVWPESRVNRGEDKAGFAALGNASELATLTSEEEAFAQPDDVVDISGFVKDGRLSWNAPEGKWRIYRFGWGLTGKQNHPAPAEATGLEVDKLDPIAWTKFFHTYLDMYKEAANGLVGQHGVQYMLTDSYEAEAETWTPAMYKEFLNRRGYDLHKWMPVLAGEVIGSPELSDAFLWDWRMNLGELITHTYDLLTEITQKEYGMKGRYAEAHEAGRCYVVDGMDVKKTSQVPMSAMWMTASWLPTNPDGSVNRNVYNLDGLESSSVAHIYGQNVAAAESFTAPGQGGLAYSYHPGNIKSVADVMLANGTNRFIIHESAHQPSDDHVPGLSLGGIGQWFNRHDTWAEQAKVWVDYMSRSCFMLQAGANVADVLIYYGEDNCIVGAYGNGAMPEIPDGYRYDFASPDVLYNMVEPVKGRLVGKFGNSYKVLWLDRNISYMSVRMLSRIAELAEKGVIICGNRPMFKAGQDGTQEEFDALAAKVWDSKRKNVTSGLPIKDVLEKYGIKPDLTASTGEFRYLHRTMEGADIYWFNKPSAEDETVEVSVRLAGLEPRIWHPDTGEIEEASYRVESGRTVVTVDMVPDDAIFIVFSGKGRKSKSLPAKIESQIASVDTPWTVNFQEKRGAPADPVIFHKLQSYTESDVFGIKYFSGTASYKNIFTLPSVSGKVLIDLGQVENLAEVWVNGQYCGTAWKTPYRVDISSAAIEGENSLELKVVNVWPNRLIGDEQKECPQRVTYTDSRAYRADSPLRPAGLLGPVRLISVHRQDLVQIEP